jgi:hypothetical protein
VRHERLPESAAVLGERVRVVLRAEGVQQARGALDVREEECDQGRKLDLWDAAAIALGEKDPQTVP